MANHVLVVGGGIIGLACAWEAARRGMRVTVVERAEFGGQASGAAAGMLAPYSENPEGPDAFFLFCLESLRLYPAFIQEIEESSRIGTGWMQSGSITVALHEADQLPLQSRAQWQIAHGAACEWLSADDLRRLEPSLAHDVVAGLWCPVESHVQAPKLVHALELACRRAGVELASRTGDVVSLEVKPAAGVRLKTASGRVFAADRAVLCTGAWSPAWERWLPISLPVHPIRGQICAYAGEAHRVRHMLFSSQAYWVGKPDGQLVCGASEDVAGYDASTTDKGIGRLIRWSARMQPWTIGRAPDHSWAGLRPATRDGWPLIGPVPGMPEIAIACGHYRNGILLAPATARWIGEELSGKGGMAPYDGAFAPDRFTFRSRSAT
jgi:glycine oxidase